MASNDSTLGTLFLIPTTLGDIEPLNVLPLTVKKSVESLDIFLVENEKSARRFIKKNHSGQVAIQTHYQSYFQVFRRPRNHSLL